MSRGDRKRSCPIFINVDDEEDKMIRSIAQSTGMTLRSLIVEAVRLYQAMPNIEKRVGDLEHEVSNIRGELFG